MILFAGKAYPASEQRRLLDELEDRINATLSGRRLLPDTVIQAIDRLGKALRAGELDETIILSGFSEYTCP